MDLDWRDRLVIVEVHGVGDVSMMTTIILWSMAGGALRPYRIGEHTLYKSYESMGSTQVARDECKGEACEVNSCGLHELTCLHADRASGYE